MALKWQFSCSSGHAEETWEETVTAQKIQELHDHQVYYYRALRPASDPDGSSLSQGTKADWACCPECGNMVPVVVVAEV